MEQLEGHTMARQAPPVLKHASDGADLVSTAPQLTASPIAVETVKQSSDAHIRISEKSTEECLNTPVSTRAGPAEGAAADPSEAAGGGGMAREGDSKLEVEPEASAEEDDAGEEESEEEEEDERKSLPCDVLLAMGKERIAEESYEDAARLFEFAVLKRVEELNGAETHPDLAEYWLYYGSGLLSHEEFCGDLFSDNEQQDLTKETAYEALDLARLCYEKKIGQQTVAGAEAVSESEAPSFIAQLKQLIESERAPAKEEGPAGNLNAGTLEIGGLSTQDLMGHLWAPRCLNPNSEAPHISYKATDTSGAEVKVSQDAPRCEIVEDNDKVVENAVKKGDGKEVENDMKNAAYTRLRLGDFHLALHEYTLAAAEYEASLNLCALYRLPFSDALSAIVPYCQCQFALDSPDISLAFHLCDLFVTKALEDLPSKMDNANDTSAVAINPQAESSASPRMSGAGKSPSKASILEERRRMLMTLKEDMRLQHNEYLAERAHLVANVKTALKEICEEIATGQKRPQPEQDEPSVPESIANEEAIDLGTLGKKRRKQNVADVEGTRTSLPKSEERGQTNGAQIDCSGNSVAINAVEAPDLNSCNSKR